MWPDGSISRCCGGNRLQYIDVPNPHFANLHFHAIIARQLYLHKTRGKKCHKNVISRFLLWARGANTGFFSWERQRSTEANKGSRKGRHRREGVLFAKEIPSKSCSEGGPSDPAEDCRTSSLPLASGLVPVVPQETEECTYSRFEFIRFRETYFSAARNLFLMAFWA